MKYGLLSLPSFQAALNRLLQTELPIAYAYNLSRIHDVIKEESTRYNDLRMGLLERYAAQDENGNIQADEAGQAVFPEGNMELFQKEIKDLHDIQFSLPCTLSLDHTNITMTAHDAGILVEAGILLMNQEMI